MGPTGPGQCKCHVLDALGNMVTSEIRMYYQTGGRHVLLVFPSLDVAESSELTVFRQCDDSLCLSHLLGQILVCAFCYTCASYFCSVGNRL